MGRPPERQAQVIQVSSQPFLRPTPHPAPRCCAKCLRYFCKFPRQFAVRIPGLCQKPRNLRPGLRFAPTLTMSPSETLFSLSRPQFPQVSNTGVKEAGIIHIKVYVYFVRCIHCTCCFMCIIFFILIKDFLCIKNKRDIVTQITTMA